MTGRFFTINILGYIMMWWFFGGCDGSRGRGEGEEKERETETEPPITTLHHITHNTHAPPFLPPSVVFLMVHDNLYAYLCFYMCLCMCTFRDLESGLSKTRSVRTGKMVNEA